MQVNNNAGLRQKKKSCDLNQLLANSPPWPPVSNEGQNFGEEDKETGPGEWVDKVMVNKQDVVSRVENPSSFWQAGSGNSPDVFYQKYLADSSDVFTEQSYNMFTGGNNFNISKTDELDDTDAVTSDSSEPDLLWQFNNSRLPTIANGITSKTNKPNPKVAKSPEPR